jgi:hypothetical protein
MTEHKPEERISIQMDISQYQEARKLALLGIQMMDDEVDKAVIRAGLPRLERRNGGEDRRRKGNSTGNGLPMEH